MRGFTRHFGLHSPNKAPVASFMCSEEFIEALQWAMPDEYSGLPH